MPRPVPKIVQLTSVHPYDDIRVFRKIARSVAKAGYDSHLIAGTDDSVPKVYREDGVTVHLFPRAYRTRLGRMTAFAGKLTWYAAGLDADVYQFHDPELLLWTRLLKILRPRAKLVFDSHEDTRTTMTDKPYLPRWAQSAVASLYAAFEDWCFRRLDGAVAATDTIAKIFPPTLPHATLRNLAMDEEIDATDFPRRPEPGLYAYMGGISVARGIDVLLDAFATLDGSSKLVLAGPVEDAFLDGKMRDTARVEYHTYLPRTEIRRLLSRCRAAAVLFKPLPAYFEAGPNKIFEYMASGVPFVASDFPVWRRLLEPIGCAKLVDPTDPKAVAEALRWFDAHPEEAEAMGRRGRDAVQARLRWSQEFEKAKELYAAILAPERQALREQHG